MSSSSFPVASLGFSMYSIMSSVNSEFFFVFSNYHNSLNKCKNKKPKVSKEIGTLKKMYKFSIFDIYIHTYIYMSYMSNMLTLAAPAKSEKKLILLNFIVYLYNKLGQKENSQLISKIFINKQTLYF